MLFRRTEYFHDAGQLFLFILTREDGDARVQFSKNATQTPHIDRQTIRHAQNNLGGSVETRLDVGVDFFVLEAT